jgi:PAS domain-containing protein
MENLDKLFRAEDLQEKFLELSRLEKKNQQERALLEEEKKEIEEFRNSVEFLKSQYDKLELEEKLGSAREKLNTGALKVHLFASKAEKELLKNKMEKLNSIIAKSPYVFLLYNVKDKNIIWSSTNMAKILGYHRQGLKGKTFHDIFLQPQEIPSVNDGFLLNQPALNVSGETVYVDMQFQPGDSNGEITLVSFHIVSERYSHSNCKN